MYTSAEVGMGKQGTKREERGKPSRRREGTLAGGVLVFADYFSKDFWFGRCFALYLSDFKVVKWFLNIFNKRGPRTAVVLVPLLRWGHED